jgi:glycosyltransferase involved in cell wall biosynthesis
MKIAVATICKNEEQFVKRWAESCADADYWLILDTGSTDRTTGFAIINGVTKQVKRFDPWRFGSLFL